MLELSLSEKWRKFKHIQLSGVMGMAICDDETAVGEVCKTANLFQKVKKHFFADSPQFKKCQWVCHPITV